MPVDVKPRVHALAIDDSDTTASIDTALAVAPSFGIVKVSDARAMAREIGTAVAGWREAAAKNGIKPNQIERMASAFEHDDLRAAIGRAVG
jgi:serine/threonine-protein kinase HipA